MKKVIEHSLLVALLIPILFINIKSSHDWGDDFAQYIHQAKNILAGISQNQTGYIFNENISVIGPKAYPTGFPLLLSAVIYFFGDGISTLNVYMSFWLIATCIIGYLILRLHTNYIVALVTALVIGYNPMLLNFKTEIMSDLPFSFFSMLSIYLLHKKETPWLSIIIGLLIGFSIHIRSIGVVLVVAVLIHSILNNGFSIKKNTKALYLLVSTFVMYLLLKIIFSCNTNYPITSGDKNLWLTVNNHTGYTFEALQNFFHQYYILDYLYIGIIASSSLIVFGMLGFILALKKNHTSFITIYSSVFIAAVVSFRFSDAGLRFFYPLLFFIFLFAIQGFKDAIKPLFAFTQWIPVVAGALILFFYSFEITRIIDSKKVVLDGPQTKQSKMVFDFIKKNIPEETSFAFDKPRALALYTACNGMMLTPSLTNEELIKEIKKYKINYILISNKISENNTKQFTETDTTHCTLLFNNEEFKLYKLNL
jgi:Dolichyl-phosphate-mannose-protein mannosyltransferase